jgi:hypothetical protein
VYALKALDLRTVVGTIVAVTLFVALAAFLYALSWNSEYAGFPSDDAFYLLMADGFSPYRPADPGLTGYVMSQSVFPPFYPLLLAALGGGSADMLISHWITTTTLLLSLLVFGLWVHQETRNLWLAIWLACIFAVLPETLLLDLETFSEFPYLLLSLLAIWLAARDEERIWNIAVVALCIGLASITRSAGISLAVAFGVWLFCQRMRGRALWLALALALAPSAIWLIYRSRGVSQAGYGAGWIWVGELLRDEGPWQFLRFLGGAVHGSVVGTAR